MGCQESLLLRRKTNYFNWEESITELQLCQPVILNAIMLSSEQHIIEVLLEHMFHSKAVLFRLPSEEGQSMIETRFHSSMVWWMGININAPRCFNIVSIWYSFCHELNDFMSFLTLERYSGGWADLLIIPNFFCISYDWV